MQRVRAYQDFTIAKLNLVDLAGVERVKKAGTDSGSLMRREACVINKSLSFLEQVCFHKCGSMTQFDQVVAQRIILHKNCFQCNLYYTHNDVVWAP